MESTTSGETPRLHAWEYVESFNPPLLARLHLNPVTGWYILVRPSNVIHQIW